MLNIDASATVKFSTSGEQKVSLECGRSRFKLLGLPRDEFPTFPAVRFNESWRVKSGDLQKLISVEVPFLYVMYWETVLFFNKRIQQFSKFFNSGFIMY